MDLEKRWIVQISWHGGLNTGGWGKLLFPVLGGKNCLNLCIAWHERTLAQIFSFNNSNRILLLPLGGNIWHQTPEPSSSFTLSFWRNQAHVHSNFTSWFTLLSSSRFVYESTQMHTNISNDLFLYCQCKTWHVRPRGARHREDLLIQNLDKRVEGLTHPYCYHVSSFYHQSKWPKSYAMAGLLPISIATINLKQEP